MNGSSGPDGASAQTLALLVDALVWPLMLLRSDGTLLHANSAALQALTTRRHVMLGPQQRLQTTDPARAEEFLAALAAGQAGQRRLMHWPGTEDCTATVMPLLASAGSLQTRPTDDQGPILLVALGMASGHADPQPNDVPARGSPRPLQGDADTGAFAKAHGLSRAEARVLQRLALGDSPARAAQALGVSVATVRSQAAAIRRKTGHSGTAALVSAAARSSPIWPDPAPQAVAQATAPPEPPSP